jgi:peptidoglycan/LPS O-acetylase OafA/YrhL
MQYRREIDGLRALAVVPVILFHAGFTVFSGGYVGVDVFFVISGYLITTIIVTEQSRGEFTLAGFYERRARRILPALFVVLAATLPFAWMLLLPVDMRSFSQSLMAVAAFASNIFFWRTSGYFDSAAELKPLLHTWSLAVEEQYYVFFPVLLLLTVRLPRRWLMGLLLAGAVVSLALAQRRVAISSAATFYLLPTRGWELLIGALIGLYRFERPGDGMRRPMAEALSVAGFLLIAASIFVYDKETPFPSVYTLAPTLGAGLILLFAVPGTVVGAVLGSRAFVGIGLISYSAYLWHQPMFALAREQALGEPGHGVMAGLALLSLVLAAFSLKFVERPFRGSRRFSRRQIFAMGIAGSLLFAGIGWAGTLTRGFDFRFAPDQRAFLDYFENSKPGWRYFERAGILEKFGTACDFYDIPKYRSGNETHRPLPAIASACYLRDPQIPHAVLVWGDSHAQHLVYGLRQTLPASWQLLEVASFGCRPRLDAGGDPQDYCDAANAFALKTMAEARPDVVVVAHNKDHSLAEISATIERLHGLGVPRIVFVGPTPHWTADLPQIVVQRLWVDTPRRTQVGIDREIMALDRTLKAGFPASPGVQLLSPIDYFCSAEGCQVYFGDDRTVGLTSFDYGHLTPIASLAFARDVLTPDVVGPKP